MATGFVILLIAVGALALAAWPICVRMARRATEREAQARAEAQHARAWRGEQVHDTYEYPQGTVVGGLHVGGGRSVAPRRDEEVIPIKDDR